MCKGKGVVTLRATLVHIDDEGHITEKPNVFTAPSESELSADEAHICTSAPNATILHLHAHVRTGNVAESCKCQDSFILWGAKVAFKEELFLFFYCCVVRII